jgi:hypothetical protein
MNSGEALSLSEHATAIWVLLLDGTSTNEVVEALAAQYGVSKDDLRHDVEGLIRDLAARELIEEAP